MGAERSTVVLVHGAWGGSWCWGRVEPLLEQLGGGAGPFLVCGHSYGGMVVTQATAGRSDVARLVYLCAFMPDAGDSLFTITGGAAPWIDVLDDGRTLPDLDRAAGVGYADCDDTTRANAIARLRPPVPGPFLPPGPARAGG